ncbi:MAG TPA: hypothetical protein VI454_20060 [Verrucomicrobiae bacterium]|jgi:hypothetical protein
MQLTEFILREQLRGVLPEEILAIEIFPARNDIDRFGETFYARDHRIMVYTARMKGFARQGRTELVEFCQRTIDALREVRDDESLFNWAAKLRNREWRVYGISTAHRLIGVHPDDFLGPSNADGHAI